MFEHIEQKLSPPTPPSTHSLPKEALEKLVQIMFMLPLPHPTRIQRLTYIFKLSTKISQNAWIS